jgi:hypothetical protein
MARSLLDSWATISFSRITLLYKVYSYLVVYFVPNIIPCEYKLVIVICFLIILIFYILMSYFKMLLTNKADLNLRKKQLKV